MTGCNRGAQGADRRPGTRGAGWSSGLDRVIAAEPLFAAAATEAGLAAGGRRPRAVYLGVGLCTRHRLSAGLPLDVLGLLLPAERLRAAVGAEQLVVLIADAHARANGFVAEQVEARARSAALCLRRVRAALGLERLVLVTASRLAAEPGYVAALNRIRSAAPNEDPYVARQTADVAFLDEALGGLLKVGWTVDPDGTGGGYRDEVAFDQKVGPYSGRSPRFAYVRPGRAFDDRRPKVSPYVGVDRSRRVYLDACETVRAKLARAPQLASKRNVAAVREHLGRVADAAGVAPGPLERRLELLLSFFHPGRRAAKTVAAVAGGSR